MCRKTPQEKEYMRKIIDASAVGSLMYTMICARLNIYFAISMVSQYQFNPSSAYQNVIKRILRYIKGIANYPLCYEGNDLGLKGYINAN